MNDIVIRGGRVIDSIQKIDGVADVLIQHGKITQISKKIEAPNTQAVDASGLVVCAGFVDLSAHMREPGFEHKGAILSEAKAAAAGGVTTLCCPPDTDPIIDTPAVARLIQDKARIAGFARVLPIGAMTVGLKGTYLSEMASLAEAGCVAVAHTYNARVDNLVLRRCFEYAATFDIPVLLTPNDAVLSANGCCNESFIGTRLGLQTIPESAETIALARDLILIEQTGVRAHVGRISCARSVAMIRDAQKRGLAVTADVAAHQLLFNDQMIDGYNSLFHVLPPLRSEKDRLALMEGVVDGTISAICSDHQPHEIAAKMAPFGETSPGIAGVQSLLPLALHLVHEKRMPLADLLARLTSGPAHALHITAGTLAIGGDADICIFNPDTTWQLNESNSYSTGVNLLSQLTLRGLVKHTLIGGRLIF
jgi:dihydroorotase